MVLSPSDAAFVEKWASKYAHYCSVFSAQVAELQKEPERFRAAYKTVADPRGFQTVAVAQRAEFMARMENNCLKEPQSFTDRVEIAFSANAMVFAIRCWILVGPSDEVQDQFAKIEREITEQLRIQREIAPQPRNISPSVPTRPLHSLEVDEFKHDPSLLLDQKFVHSVVVGDGELRRPYEFVEFGMTKEVGRWFRICYEDTRELERLDPEEMDNLLENSLIVDYDLASST